MGQNTVHSVTAGSKVTINSGGYVQIGRMVILSFKATTTSAINQNEVIVSGIPATYQNVFINIGTGYNPNAYSCRTGNINIYANGSIPSGTEININAAYLSV